MLLLWDPPVHIGRVKVEPFVLSAFFPVSSYLCPIRGQSLLWGQLWCFCILEPRGHHLSFPTPNGPSYIPKILRFKGRMLQVWREKYDETEESNRALTPIVWQSIAIHLPFLSWRFCKSMPSSWQKVLYIPPICITIRLPCVSRYFCGSIRVRGRWKTPK